MKLQLGVLDQTYRAGESTGTVAKILETKYGIMAIFAAQQSTQIANSLAVSLADATEAIMSGAPMANPYAEGTDQIQEAFQRLPSKGFPVDSKTKTTLRESAAR
jgi:hypothetical protein